MANGFPDDLIDGYRAFAGNRLSHERERWRALAEQGQRPQTMVIACCDSRAAPEIIFDAAPGELFVVRNVANLVPPYEPDGEYHGTSAALEFAVQALGVSNIVVLGHARCGGIAAALANESEPLSPGDFIGKWVGLVGRLAEGFDASSPDAQTALERASVRASLENLRSFPWLAALEEEGALSLHGAWFEIASGELWTLNTRTGDFEPVTQAAPAHAPQ